MMRCSAFAVAIAFPFIAYILHIGFGPTAELEQPAAIDTSAFDELSPVDAAERLLELVSIPTVTQHAPISNASAGLLLQLHQRRFQPQRALASALTPASGLKATYPDAHSLLKREVVNKYSLLYTLDGSDPSLSPLLVCANMSCSACASPCFSQLTVSSFRTWTLCPQQKRIGSVPPSKVGMIALCFFCCTHHTVPSRLHPRRPCVRARHPGREVHVGCHDGGRVLHEEEEPSSSTNCAFCFRA
jgi:hypothetical protein